MGNAFKTFVQLTVPTGLLVLGGPFTTHPPPEARIERLLGRRPR